jgi:solute carrier organic anion transporter family, member 5A
MKSRPKMQQVKQEEPSADEEDIEEQEVDDEDDDLDTSCGFGPCKKIGFLNKYFANKDTFIFVYGVLGCVYGSTYAYSNATLSTIEKRFKIPSKVTGIFLNSHFNSR